MPDLIAGIGMVALAALALWLAPKNRLHRAFAVMQVVNAGVSLAYVGAMGLERTDPALSAVWESVWNYFILAWPFAVAFFSLRFLDPAGRSRASRPLGFVLLLAVIAALVSFATDHGTMFSLQGAGDVALGPLGIVWFTDPIAYGTVALLFAIAARRAGNATRRAGFVLGSLAFILPGVLWSAAVVAPERFVLDNLTGPPLKMRLVGSAPRVGALTIAGTVCLVLLVPPLRGDAATRGVRRLFAAGVGSSALSALAIAGLVIRDPATYEWLPYTADGVWRIIMTMLLAYAILKRQLLDVEVRLRFAISRSTMAAVFVAVFFIVSEAAQQVFDDTTGSAYLGIAAAGALVFVLAPVQRAAERLAAKAVPVSSIPPTTWLGAEAASREEAYRRVLRVALRSRHPDPEEEVHLAELAEHLGIGAGRAVALMREVGRDVGVRR